MEKIEFVSSFSFSWVMVLVAISYLIRRLGRCEGQCMKRIELRDHTNDLAQIGHSVFLGNTSWIGCHTNFTVISTLMRFSRFYDLVGNKYIKYLMGTLQDRMYR